MSAIKFQFKHSTTTGAIPTVSDIGLGELALNVPDTKAFLRKLDDSIVDISNTDSPSPSEVTEVLQQVIGGVETPAELRTLEGIANALGNNPNLYQTLNTQLTALSEQIDTLLTNAQVDVLLSSNSTNETRSAVITVPIPKLQDATVGRVVLVNFSGFKLANNNRDNVLGMVHSIDEGANTMKVITAGESEYTLVAPTGTVVYLGLNGQPTTVRPTRNKVIQLGTVINDKLIVYVKHYGHVDETPPSAIPLIKNPDTTVDGVLDVISAGRHSSVIWYVTHVTATNTYYGVFSLMHDGFADIEATAFDLTTLREVGTLPTGAVSVTYSSIMNEFTLQMDAQDGKAFVRRMVM